MYLAYKFQGKLVQTTSTFREQKEKVFKAASSYTLGVGPAQISPSPSSRGAAETSRPSPASAAAAGGGAVVHILCEILQYKFVDSIKICKGIISHQIPAALGNTQS